MRGRDRRSQSARSALSVGEVATTAGEILGLLQDAGASTRMCVAL